MSAAFEIFAAPPAGAACGISSATDAALLYSDDTHLPAIRSGAKTTRATPKLCCSCANSVRTPLGMRTKHLCSEERAGLRERIEPTASTSIWCKLKPHGVYVERISQRNFKNSRKFRPKSAHVNSAVNDGVLRQETPLHVMQYDITII